MEFWRIDKPAVRSPGGVVVTQHLLASEAGAEVLRAGGNAVDAAIAASFVLGVVEPWMSGIGGGGLMISLGPDETRARSFLFGMRASNTLDPFEYPLSGGVGGDLFTWPAVKEDRNVHGPYAVAVPGQVAGMALAHERLGSMPWRDLLRPAIDICRQGMEVDWMGTVRIAAAAPVLARYAESARLYLPGGRVPAGQWGGPAPRIHNAKLVTTLEQLSREGGTDFYRGEIARSIVSDARDLGVAIGEEDLRDYAAVERDAMEAPYRGARVYVSRGLTGGPSLIEVLGYVTRVKPAEASPTAEHFLALAAALTQAFETRFESMGHDEADPACTSHISVVDRRGHAVSLTQTLLSVFGSKVMLPGSGILLNNGIMWFDPRPGRANSIAPGRLPLANMCPVVLADGTGRRTALGGSGGRRIIGAVAQILAWMVDYGKDAEAALAQPRIDVSSGSDVLVDPRLAPEVMQALSERYSARPAQSLVYPNLYGCPNCASHVPGEGAVGAAFPYSPSSAAVVAETSP